jgi:LPXTG-site transpeptidase (sortase) family protein
MKYKAMSVQAIRWVLAGIGTVAIVSGAVYALSLYYFNSPMPTPVIKQPLVTAPTDTSPEKTVVQKARYTVPSSHPREIRIPSIGVDANIMPVGTTSDGTLAAPLSAWDVGWFDKSNLPGAGSGALLLDGHVNNRLGTPGIFYELRRLKVGDSIQIERGDHTVINYRIVTVVQVPVDRVDMRTMVQPVSTGKEGLNLITCGGQYDSERRTFVDRILVYSVRI